MGCRESDNRFDDLQSISGQAIHFTWFSKLFGAPEEDKSAVEIAALGRDEQLVLVGREAVGMTVGIPKRQEGKEQEPKDELDDVVDALDEMDL